MGNVIFFQNWFSFLAFQLDKGCLERLEDFLMAALNEMQSDCHLWFAFQPNTLKDFNPQLPKDWPQMISEMKSRLENHFYVPTLSNNLRNSSEVFNMTEVVQYEHSSLELKDSLGVTTVAMTIHATTPKLIPILPDEDGTVPVDAILFAVEKTREETGDQSSSFVILHDEVFTTDELFESIKSNKSQYDEVFKYPPNQEDVSPSLEYLDELMDNKVHGFLVLKDKSFKGAEARHLILVMHDGGNISDMRCNMLRCISNLSIIQVILERELVRFDKIRLFDNFMSCFKKCKEFIHECQTCLKEQKNQCGEQNKKNVFFCRSCKMRTSCHPIDHDFKQLNTKDFKVREVKCGCHCNK